MTKKEAFDFLDRMARGIAVMFGEQCETIGPRDGWTESEEPGDL